MKKKMENIDFFELWLNRKIEKMQQIEQLCSAIMDVLEIPPKPSGDFIGDKAVDDDFKEIEHYGTNGIKWKEMFSEMFYKMQRGEKVVEYKDWRKWYEFERTGGMAVNRLFYNETSDNLDTELQKDIAENPLWIETPPYGASLDSFRAIRQDCEILSNFLKIDDTIFDEKDFGAIEHTVNGFIQGVFTLIGVHDQELQDKQSEIKEKLLYYEDRDRQRKQAYIDGPGAMSKEQGELSVQKAKDILEEVGGIAGYDTLPHGRKTPIINKIAKALNPRAEAPSTRNVNKLLNKIRNEQNKN